ncbi:MAG: hypothetical protein K8S87_07430 [Planctomycetes bacterium]|nr:hypothetical protein [Planctomycetota bacterium]
MNVIFKTAFVLFIIFSLTFSVVYAQDDDDTMEEPDGTEEEIAPTRLEVSLFELLWGLASGYKTSMIITPDTEKVSVKVYVFQEIIKKAEELKDDSLAFDDFLTLVLETYGYNFEVRNGVYIIRPIDLAAKKDAELTTIKKSYVIPAYFKLTDIVEQFTSFIGKEDKVISNSSSRVIFVMASQIALATIDQYFEEINKHANTKLDFSDEENRTKADEKKSNLESEVETKIDVNKQIFRFPNSIEQIIVDLGNLLPTHIDSDTEQWTIINEDEKLILITGTAEDVKMVGEYIKEIKLSQGNEVEIPLAEKIDTRVYTLARPVEDFAKDLETFLTEKGKIVTNPEKNFLIIKDRVTNFILLERFIQELDAEPQQVYIEATFMEIKLDNDFKFGLDSTAGATEGTTNFNAASSGGTSGFSFGVLQSNKDNSWSVQLNALSTNTDSNILSRPRVLIKNGKPAKIVVGQEVPYLTTDESEGGITQTVEFKDVSITMEVTPHVEPGDRIRMIIKISIKEQVGTISLGGSDTPITSNRELSTEVFVDSGNTLIMGGLYENKITESLTGLPIVGELPIIGTLFSTRVNTNRKTDLLFFITPTIVKPKDEVEIIRKGRVLKFFKHTNPVEPPWLSDPAAKRFSK